MEGSPKIGTERNLRDADDEGAQDVVGEPVDALKTDATDQEQSSDDEAPEEVSAAAATALAGRRRKEEHQARHAAPGPKRKRPRSSSSRGAVSSKNASSDDSGKGNDGDLGGQGGSVDDGLELPQDLLLRVKSGGLQRMEADAMEAKMLEEQAAAAVAEGDKEERRRERIKAKHLPRSDNFKLVVLDEDGGGVDDGARSKSHAAQSAKNFLRDRMGSRKRVSHSLFKARKRLGPSPDF